MKPKTVLVTGATGHQGGVVAERLARKGHRVRAMTRRPDSAAAVRLRRLGAQVVVGDFDEPVSLDRAMEGVDAVFAMSTPFEAGPAVEARQGMAIADAAQRQSVPHLVYSSVGGADRMTGIPHFDSKHAVEQHIRTLRLPHTIVAPVYFMENVLSPMMVTGLQAGLMAMPMPPHRPLQQVALADIGTFAALVIERRESFLGKRIELASDELTPSEEVELIARALGREIRYLEVSIEQVRATSEDMARMFEWFNNVGYQVDIEQLRRDYPEVGWHRFADWLRTQDLSYIHPTPPAYPLEEPQPGV